ncbi:MAG: hypothetical protein IPF68_14355 [Bacteroidales bacterium]|nr:hypothetical protein [Bacteroidales bacterium]
MKAFISEGDSNTIAFLIKQNEKITAIRGNVHIKQFGLVKITQKADSFVKNDTAYILSYLGEGYYDAWYKGEIIQFQDCDPSFTNCNPSFTTLKPAKTEWWVYIKNGSAKFGWLRILDHDLSNIDGRNIY